MKTTVFSFIVLLCLLAIDGAAQEFTLTGKVIDESTKETLTGVTVLVKGTQNATSTDYEGMFNIKLSVGNTLVIQFLSYEKQEFIVGNGFKNAYSHNASDDMFTVLLKPIIKEIEGAVCKGYFSEKPSNSIDAFDNVSEKELRSATSNSVDQMLQGRASVMVTTSGSPGADSKMAIRGLGTINNSDPLYVVDGIPQSSSPRINSNDIKSVTVLKDASACSIYGSRGANGVVVIVTKGGEMKRINEGRTYQYRSDRTYKGTAFVVDSIIIDSMFDFKKWGFKKRQVAEFYLERQKNGMAYIFMDTKEYINENLKNFPTKTKEWILTNPHCQFSLNDSLQTSKAIVLKTLNTHRVIKTVCVDKKEAIKKFGDAGKFGIVEIFYE